MKRRIVSNYFLRTSQKSKYAWKYVKWNDARWAVDSLPCSRMNGEHFPSTARCWTIVYLQFESSWNMYRRNKYFIAFVTLPKEITRRNNVLESVWKTLSKFYLSWPCDTQEIALHFASRRGLKECVNCLLQCVPEQQVLVAVRKRSLTPFRLFSSHLEIRIRIRWE